MILAWLGVALAAPLTLPDVLDGLDARVPKLQAVDAKVAGARGGLLAKRGVFDPTLVGKAKTYGGKYVRDHVVVGLEAQTLFGPEIHLGYTRGTGDIPDYAGDTKTPEEGELVAQVDVPLLKGLGFGGARADLLAAKQKVALTEAARVDAERRIRWKAGKTYWSWVAAGMDLRIAEEQLRLAERRAAALIRQVEEGSKAPLDRLDNERVLEERRAKVALARQKLVAKAVELSLYHRSEDGAPIVPTDDELPEAWSDPEPLPEADRIDQAVELRPDLQAVRNTLELASLQRRAANNALLPDLTVTGIAIEPLDADTKRELVAGVSLKAPLALRKGRGQLQAREASLVAAEAEARLAMDTVQAEVATALAIRERAGERAASARIAAQRAREVLELERRRYALGGSDLFQLLLREDKLAKARSLAVEAERDLRIADVDLHAVLGR